MFRSTLSLLTPGCLTTDSPQSSPTNDLSPTAERETTRYELGHEVWKKEKFGGYHGEEVQFGELSDQGQDVSSKASNQGGHSVVYNTTNKPPDFRYSDETTTYNVTCQDNQYVLLTYTSSGCDYFGFEPNAVRKK